GSGAVAWLQYRCGLDEVKRAPRLVIAARIDQPLARCFRPGERLNLLDRLVDLPRSQISARAFDALGRARRRSARRAHDEQFAEFAPETGPQTAAALAIAANELRGERIEFAAQLLEGNRVARGIDDRLYRIGLVISKAQPQLRLKIAERQTAVECPARSKC